MNQTPPALQAPYKAALVAAARDYLRATGPEGCVIEIPGMVPPCVIVLGDETHVCVLLRDPAADQLPGGRRVNDPPPASLSWEEPMPGAPRKWTILLSSENHGLVGALGSMHEHAAPHFERVDVVELEPFVDQLATALQQNAQHLEEVQRLRARVAELQSQLGERAAAPVQLPPLDEELIAILGRPNFMCGGIAARMRQLGHDIKTRAENEQAAVLHLLLAFYLKHGTDEWADRAGAYLDQEEAEPEAAASKEAGEE